LVSFLCFFCIRFFLIVFPIFFWKLFLCYVNDIFPLNVFCIFYLIHLFILLISFSYFFV
jgi:hypothetical protein